MYRISFFYLELRHDTNNPILNEDGVLVKESASL